MDAGYDPDNFNNHARLPMNGRYKKGLYLKTRFLVELARRYLFFFFFSFFCFFFFLLCFCWTLRKS